MEACSGAIPLGPREFSQFGHEVILYAPQHVKTQTNRNDYNDAGSHCQSRSTKDLTPVPHKSVEQTRHPISYSNETSARHRKNSHR
ncbi:hypothetical protein OK016_18470 [Vibrio chagasii]|nr:hypothetical protein [Vibrio chagasii]